MNKIMYVLEITSKEVYCEARVNDIIVANIRPESQKTTQVKLSPYMVSGRNIIELTVSRHDDESSRVLDVAVLSGERGTQPGEENIECKYQWSEELSPLTALEETEPKPYLCMSFEVEGVPPKIWQAVKPIDLSSDDKEAINQVVAQTRKALESRDQNYLLSMLETKHTELAKALGCDKQKLVGGTEGLLNHCFNSANWAVLGVDWSDIQYVAQAENRVFTIQNGKSEAFVRGKTDQQSIPFELSFSKLNDQWTVVL